MFCESCSESVSTGEAKPSDILMNEHRIIERVLDATERMLEAKVIDKEFLTKAVDFFRNFADGCHHAKEEEEYFPLLERRGVPVQGGPIGCMLNEHDLGRALVKKIAANLDAADNGDDEAAQTVRHCAHQFIELLREHIQKEDKVLFVMGDAVLSAEDKKNQIEAFSQAKHCNPDKHTHFLELADELSQWSFAIGAKS